VDQGGVGAEEGQGVDLGVQPGALQYALEEAAVAVGDAVPAGHAAAEEGHVVGVLGEGAGERLGVAPGPAVGLEEGADGGGVGGGDAHGCSSGTDKLACVHAIYASAHGIGKGA
jgi:hypothetical protein